MPSAPRRTKTGSRTCGNRTYRHFSPHSRPVQVPNLHIYSAGSGQHLKSCRSQAICRRSGARAASSARSDPPVCTDVQHRRVLDASQTEKYANGKETPTENEIYAATGEVADGIDANTYQSVVNTALNA